jgi:hypothetical protein
LIGCVEFLAWIILDIVLMLFPFAVTSGLPGLLEILFVCARVYTRRYREGALLYTSY